MIYNNLILQPNIWNKLNSYLIKGKLPNAFLFHGDDGVGKEAHAIEFASLINCLNPVNNQICNICDSCKRMKTLQHGNLKIIHPMPRGKATNSSNSPFDSLSKSEIEDYTEKIILKSKNPYYKIKLEKSNSILISSIRSIKKELILTPVENGRNIILIFEAEKLCYPNNISANALLKTLEEPPKNTLFILITANISQIIDTIKSRCQTLFFPSLSIEQISSFIDNTISESDKLIIANISGGNIGLIQDLQTSLDEIYANLKLFINSCYTSNCEYDKTVIEKINLLKRMNNNNLMLFFRTIMIYFKDLFVFSKTNDIKYIVYKNLNKHYEKITAYHHNTKWEICIEILENCIDNIYRNASIPLSVNGMLIELRKIINNDTFIPFNINNWMKVK